MAIIYSCLWLPRAADDHSIELVAQIFHPRAVIPDLSVFVAQEVDSSSCDFHPPHKFCALILAYFPKLCD